MGRLFERSGLYLILFGALWATGDVLGHFFANNQIEIWSGISLFAVIACGYIGVAQKSGKAARLWLLKFALTMAILVALSASFPLLSPLSSSQAWEAVTALLLASTYLMIGVWSEFGRRMCFTTGVLTWVATLAGYLLFPRYFSLWMALVGGLSLVVPGVWLRTVLRRPYKPKSARKAQPVTIEGTHDKQFSAVVDAFRRNFNEGPDVGAAVCVYHQGRPVVDLWGGIANAETGSRWHRHTLTGLASTSKALAAVSALRLVERGVLDLDAPIAKYWPEFAANGKERIPLRWLLSHRSGVVALDRPIGTRDIAQLTPVAELIAASRPSWTPGAAHGYHGVTFGFAVAEIIRRVTGQTLGTCFAREVAGPLGLDLFIGLEEKYWSHVAPMIGPTTEEALRGMQDPAFAEYTKAISDRSSLLHRTTFGNLAVGFDDKQKPEDYASEDASTSAFGNAAGLARMFAATIGEVDGLRILRADTVEKARHAEASGADRVLCMRTDWGLGFMLPGGPMWPGFGARAFGHCGASGSLGFADPETGIAFGYTPNKWADLMGGSDSTGMRFQRLIEATYKSLRTLN
jgi:CubicO group peptidase (beta-lactamase class C family)